MTLFGTSAKLHRRGRARRLAPHRRRTPRHGPHDHVDRLAARAGELRLRLRAASSATSISLRSPAAPTSSAASSAAIRRAGVARRDPGARARHGGRVFDDERDSRCAARRASSCARCRSRRCRSASGTTRTAAKYHAAYFARVPRRLVPRRLRRADRARRDHHPRPLGRGAQSRRRPHRHGGDLPPGRAAPRSRREPRDRPAVGGDERVVLFVRLRDGVDARRRARRSHPATDPREHDAASRAGPDRARSPTSRAPRAARSSSWPCARSFTAARSRIARRSPILKRWSSSAIGRSSPALHVGCDP